MVAVKRRSSTTTCLSENINNWPSIYVIGLSTFAVVTTEMLPVGLMTPISAEMNVSLAIAGLMISVPAILAALCAPAIIIGAGNVDRRSILLGLLALLIIANLASAFAPSIDWLLGARIIVGISMGGIWAIAGGLAPRLVSAQSTGLATSIIFGGVAAASVLGVPIGAFVGDYAGWRWAFIVMAIFSTSVLMLAWLTLPVLPINQSISVKSFITTLALRQIRLGLMLTFLFVSGHFMAFAFIRPLLETLANISEGSMGILLFAYGLAGIAGNFLTGTYASRRINHTLMTIGLLLTMSIIAFVFFSSTPANGAIILILWGLAYGGVSVGLQTWMMKAGSSSVESATSLFVSIFNIGIAFGSFMGGHIIHQFSLTTTLLIAAALPASGVLIFIASEISAAQKLRSTF